MATSAGEQPCYTAHGLQVAYLALNHAILGLVLVLARGDSGVLDAETNQTQLNPRLILPALSPLYRGWTKASGPS